MISGPGLMSGTAGASGASPHKAMRKISVMFDI